MYGAYAARLADGRVFSFYHANENGVCQRIWENGRWGGALSLAVDAKPGFEAAYNDGRFCILYQNRENSPKLIAGTGGGYVSESLPEGWGFRPCRLIASRNGLRLFYEEKTDDGLRLMSVSRANGRWGSHKTVDAHVGGFTAHVVSDDHGVLFYHIAGKDPCFGYREFNADNEGSFHPIHIKPVAAYSCLTTADSAHFLYSIRTVFGYRLCYRKLGHSGLTAATTVHEGARHEECQLFIINGKIHACFLSGGQPYLCESSDWGRSFKNAVRYRSKFCTSAMKASIIADSRGADSFAAREVFVDAQNPWDVQMIPDLYEDFYTSGPSVRQSAQAVPAVQPAPGQETGMSLYPSDRLVTPERQEPARERQQQTFNNADQLYASDISEERKLRNQLEMMERKLAEKDRQIMNLESLRREVETQRAVIERLYRDRDNDRGSGDDIEGIYDPSRD